MSNEQRTLDFDRPYPWRPGDTDDDTSKAAAKAIEPLTGHLRRAVLHVLRQHPASADQIADELQLNILSIRPRCSELLALGLIHKTTQRAKNRSGKMAVVYAIAPIDAQRAHDIIGAEAQ